MNKAQQKAMLEVEIKAAHDLGRKLRRVLRQDYLKLEPFSLELALALMLFLRSERTLSSIATLSKLGSVDDAAALARNMVEKVINAEYIVVSGLEVALEYMQFASFRAWRDYKDLHEFSPVLTTEYKADTLIKMEQAHDSAVDKTLPSGKTVKRFGRGTDWSQLGLQKRAETVDRIMTERQKRSEPFRATQILFFATYKRTAAYVHGTFSSIGRSFSTERTEDTNNSGPSDSLVEITMGMKLRDRNLEVALEALDAANLTAISLLLFLGSHFEKSAYLRWVDAFKRKYVNDRKVIRQVTTNPQG